MSELNLTDAQKLECEKVTQAIVNYAYEKLKIKMQSVSFEVAIKEILEEMLNE